MKKYQIIYSVLAVVLAWGMTSCTDYLDKEGDSTITEEVAFKNFHNFQGFIDEIYNCIPNKVNVNYTVSFNWGDDEILNTGDGNGHFTSKVDNGNFRNWSQDDKNWLYRSNADSKVIDVKRHALWNHAWYCIRKANLGLANLDKMVGTQEEKNLIAGQLYFFRAWWLEEMMQWWGPLPYLDHAIGASEEMRFPRPTYQEAAEKCYADFHKAAELLPVNWDNTAPGRQTSSENNKLRVTRMAALGYAGKVLLWAASPLMENGAQLGALKNGNTYKYNTALAQRAADIFGELLTLVESGTTPLELAEFSFDDVYNHKATKAAENNSYSNLFYTTNLGWAIPGLNEAIFRGGAGDSRGYNDCTLFQFAKTWGPKNDNLIPDDKVVHHPTANYVNYAYGMADGTPAYILENGQWVPNTPAKGGSFDVEHPFRNRDPRFYHDIIFDGFRYVETDIPNADMKQKYQYSRLYTGGNVREATLSSRTGYFTQKLVPHQCNNYDNGLNWGTNISSYLTYMRLADIYLMYAEAGAAVSGATFKSSNYNKTAEEAINVLRDRVGAGHVAVGLDKNKFMDEVRRERACELAFEGFRFNDLQRWLLLTEKPYTVKTSQEFDRAEPDSYFEEGNDPKDAKVNNWRDEVILERNYGKKHYWFPLLDKDVYLYAEFPQNYGWSN